MERVRLVRWRVHVGRHVGNLRHRDKLLAGRVVQHIGLQLQRALPVRAGCDGCDQLHDERRC